MSQISKTYLILSLMAVIAAVVLVFPAAFVFAADFDDDLNGDWNIGTTWGGGCSSSCTEGTDYPGASDTALIDSHTVTMTVNQSVSSTTINGGTLTMGANTLNVSSNWTYSSGTFNADTSTVRFNLNNHRTINANGETFYNIEFDAVSNFDMGVVGTTTVSNVLTFTNLGGISSGVIAVEGDVVSTDAVVDGLGFIVFNGDDNQTLSANGGVGGIPRVRINKISNTLFIYDTIQMGGEQWRYVTGDVNTGTSTVKFVANSHTTVDAEGMSFYNLEVDIVCACWILTVIGTTTVSNNLTITTMGSYGTGTIVVGGDLVSTSPNTGVNFFVFNGVGNQTLSASGGTGGIGNVRINKPSGTLFIQDTIHVNGPQWRHVAGDVNAGTSTVKFTANTHTTIDSEGMSFYNIEFDLVCGCWNVTVDGTLTVSNDLTLTLFGSITGSIAVSGDVTSTRASIGGAGTITLNGTGLQNLDISSGDIPGDTFTLNKPSGIARLISDFTPNEDFTITSGTFDQNGFDFTMEDVTVSSSGTWYNASTTDVGDPSTTTISSTVTNNGIVYWNGGGTSCGDSDDIQLRSSSGGAQRAWSGTGTTTAKDVDIKDMGGTNTVNVINSTDAGGNDTNWTFTGSCGPTIAQSAFRWFANEDSVSVSRGVSQDYVDTMPNRGLPFRLRMLLHITDVNLGVSGDSLKLQHAQKLTTCNGLNHVYTDVTLSSNAVRYNNNTTPSDADAITGGTNLEHGSDTIVAQSYEEQNNFTNSEAGINIGEDGLWDFALLNNMTDTGTSYCFRVVKAEGGELIDSYDSVAEIRAAGSVSVRLVGAVRLRSVRLF